MSLRLHWNQYHSHNEVKEVPNDRHLFLVGELLFNYISSL